MLFHSYFQSKCSWENCDLTKLFSRQWFAVISIEEARTVFSKWKDVRPLDYQPLRQEVPAGNRKLRGMTVKLQDTKSQKWRPHERSLSSRMVNIIFNTQVKIHELKMRKFMVEILKIYTHVMISGHSLSQLVLCELISRVKVIRYLN